MYTRTSFDIKCIIFCLGKHESFHGVNRPCARLPTRFQYNICFKDYIILVLFPSKFFFSYSTTSLIAHPISVRITYKIAILSLSYFSQPHLYLSVGYHCWTQITNTDSDLCPHSLMTIHYVLHCPSTICRLRVQVAESCPAEYEQAAPKAGFNPI